MDPVVPAVGQVLDVLEGVPLEVEAGPGDAEALLLSGRPGQVMLLLLLLRMSLQGASEGLLVLLLLRGQVGRAGVGITVVIQRPRRGRLGSTPTTTSGSVRRGRMRMGRPDVPVGRVDHDVLGEGVDGGDGRGEAEVDEELDGLRPHDGSPDGEVDEGDVGRARFVTDRDGHGGPDVGDGTSQGLGPALGVGGHPHHVLRLLGALAEGGAEAVRPAAGHLPVVDVDQFGPDGILEGRGAEVAVGQLVRLGPRPEPHLGDVESHDVARGGQDGLDRVGRLVEETVLVLRLEQRGRRRRGSGGRRRRPRSLREAQAGGIHLAVVEIEIVIAACAGRGRHRRQGRARRGRRR